MAGNYRNKCNSGTVMNQPSNILRSRKFGDNWRLNMNRSYDWVIDYANNLNPSFVIDAGCGRNVYKNKIQNLLKYIIL